MRKLYLLILILFTVFQFSVQAQEEGGVSIGKGNKDADPSAILELVSTNKGILIPRLSSTERESINSPAKGLLVYDTTLNTFYFWNSSWRAIAGVNSSVGVTLPASGSEGDLFFNTSENALFVRTDGQWETISSQKQVLSLDDSTLRLLEAGQATGSEVDLSVLFQELSIDGTKISISNGNSIDLGTIANAPQKLSLSGAILSISNGNSVDFSSLLGGSGSGDMVKATYDANNNSKVDDADRVNGKTVGTSVPSGAVFTDNQRLSVSGDQLTISNGNTVTLPAGSGTGSGDMLKATYDANDDSKVDNAEKVNGFTVEANVPAGALFSDDQSASEVVNTAAGTISSTTVQDAINELDTEKLAKDAVFGGDVSGTYDAIEIGADKITATEIVDGSVANADLDKSNIPLSGFAAAGADVSLGGFKITDMAVPVIDTDAATKKYVDDAVSAAGGGDMLKATYDSNDDGVVDEALQATNFSGSLIGDVNGTQGATTIATGAVTSDKLADESVSVTKLKGITANGTAGQTLSSNGDGSLTWTDALSLSGDVSMLSTGAVTVEKLQNVSVSANAPANGEALVFDGTDWAPQAISATDEKVKVGATGTAQVLSETDFDGTADIVIKSGAVTATKLADNAVETTKIMDGAVTGAKLAAESVTPDKLAGISTNGTSGQVLSSNADGTMSWTNATDGTVRSVSVATVNGVSGTVSNSTTHPEISLSLEDITPTSVAVNDAGAAADPSAALDVSSTTQGVLVPRMTEAQRVVIPGPAVGLMVFQTDGNPSGFYYYTGSAWAALGSVFSASNGLTVTDGTVGLGGTLSSTTTINQADNDLTFTTGTNGKTIVDGSFKAAGAVYGHVRTYAGSTGVDWQDDDFVIYVTNYSLNGSLALPDPTLNPGRVVAVRNNSGGALAPISEGTNGKGPGFYWPENCANLMGGTGKTFISDGEQWHNISY